MGGSGGRAATQKGLREAVWVEGSSRAMSGQQLAPGTVMEGLDSNTQTERPQ